MSRPRRPQSTTYVEIMRRIKEAQTIKTLNAIDRTIDRHYANNTITARELARLDTKIMEAIATMTTKEPTPLA